MTRRDKRQAKRATERKGKGKTERKRKYDSDFDYTEI